MKHMAPARSSQKWFAGYPTSISATLSFLLENSHVANIKSFCSLPNNVATASEVLNKTEPSKKNLQPIKYSSLNSESVSVNHLRGWRTWLYSQDI